MKKSFNAKSQSRTVRCCATLALIGIVLHGNTGTAAGNAETQGCTVLTWDKKLVGFPYLPVRQPGKYCIDQDYILNCSETLGTCGSGPSTPFVDIRASNVELDLQGHTFSRNGRHLTISAVGKNITIRNGVIKNGSIFMDRPESPGGPINSDKPSVEPEFELDGFMSVEGLRIEGGSINIIGANAVIHNNTILQNDMDYFASIGIYGPRPIVTGNTIERSGMSFRSQARPYGIYLRSANRGLVQRNIIEKHGLQRNTVAIGVRSSQEVRIENNTIRNFSLQVERIGKGDLQPEENGMR